MRSTASLTRRDAILLIGHRAGGGEVHGHAHSGYPHPRRPAGRLVAAAVGPRRRHNDILVPRPGVKRI